MNELPKAYEPKQYEDNIYKRWEDSGFFAPTGKSEETFSMVLPPPNVTGTLHMGHAVMLAVQDVMTRYHRMKGDRTLWLPGTDHAAIATESKVEKLLMEAGTYKPKETLGRDAFLARVNAFAAESHDTIVNQAKKMGSSMDWGREAFTLDATREKAVRSVFKMMYDEGLIYRGFRTVNWSTVGQSTCSDDEVDHITRQSKLYTFKYSENCPITIATTRPETKLGDTAIAVHPEGKWKQYIGQTFTVENFANSGNTLTLKVFGDEGIEDDFGTGALGVTTAHSHIDFEMYTKQKAMGNDIGMIQVIGEDGKMTAEAGGKYAGMTVDEARSAVVEQLRADGLLLEEEEIEQNVGVSDRFKDVIEVLPKMQWFIDVNKEFAFKGDKLGKFAAGDTVTLKQLMQEAVSSKAIKIVPERFEKTYFHWINNLRDWCISRQIWYGHQIPFWTKGDETYVGVDAPEGDGWEQDPDTLDTWFSSGLWTFSTLANTPEDIRIEDGKLVIDTEEFRSFHPTSVLETGYDILFFWVARMIMMSTYAVGEIPFETVYLHGLVRDEQGRKMSKSLGNILDPLDMTAKYGTDATRLSLLIGATPGNDMKLSEEKVEGFRNFTNKLWNISRFMLMNIESPTVDIARPETATLADTWILARLDSVVADVTTDIEEYRFSMAGERLRDFTWNELADWYLEIAKIEGEKSDMLNYVLNTILTLWHPYMPYVTEQIWTEVYGDDAMLMTASWPTIQSQTGDVEAANASFETLRDIITQIRSVRAEYSIPPATLVNVIMRSKEHRPFVGENVELIMGLARVQTVELSDEIENTDAYIGSVVGGIEVYVDLAGAVDTDKEKERLQKEIDHVAPYIKQLQRKLSGPFAANAPAPVVEKERQKLADAEEKLTALEAQLAKLS